MNPATDLTIVTTATPEYVRFLADWVTSVAGQTLPPASVLILGNGLSKTDRSGIRATIRKAGLTAELVGEAPCSPGRARNLVVALATTPWVMHLDADDMLFREGLYYVAAVTEEADVISLAYQQWWRERHHYERAVGYEPCDGLQALQAGRIASGCSPFRVALWTQWHYPEHLQASWDYGLWLGFAHLGARFRPTARPVFRYRQWEGSHWRRVGAHRREDFVTLRGELEADFPAAQAANLRQGMA